MALTEILNKKVEIPLIVEIPLSDIGDFIKKQKDSLVSTIKTYHKNYIAAANAQEAFKRRYPVKPPDGPKRAPSPANSPSAATNPGYSSTQHRHRDPPQTQLQPKAPIIERFEIPLATKEDFVQIQAPPVMSGACYFGQGNRGNEIFIRGNSIGNGIFITGNRMPPPDPAMVSRANDLLETTEEIKSQKIPDSRDIPANAVYLSPKELNEILDILYKNKRI